MPAGVARWIASIRAKILGIHPESIAFSAISAITQGVQIAESHADPDDECDT